MIRLIAALVVLSVLFAGCTQSEADEKVVILGPNQVPCEQGMSDPCYLIKEQRSDPWRVVDSTIEHLDPVDGFEYTILVRETPNETEDPYDVPKVTFYVIDVIEEREIMGRIKWYYD